MIVVTTPTGTIGSQVLDRLLAAGEPVRVIARRPERLPDRVRDSVEVVAGSHGDPDVVTKAFAGADAVFWLAPPNPAAATVNAPYLDFARPAAEAIRSQGVRRVVSVSALGRGTPMAANAGLVTASLAMDDLIASTGVAFRALALPGFMDNMLRQVTSIRGQGMFVSTFPGERRLPTCATRDIAAAAAGLLRDDSWSGQDSVAVLGPEDLSGEDMARIMTDVLGRPIRFQRVPTEAYHGVLVAQGWSAPMAQAMIDMVAAKDAGLDDAEPRTPASTSPTGFRQWCEEVLRPAVEG
ncbi:NAD(P)H-binding protein [Frankia sp. AgB32]|uniref:NAD(P)H-binding protein n=1 Tax=Frankia sp. AgB32 TaxID=631119 RepID=UPI00200FF337|nr:NAD(P)H-binding protein [Frankia sp. AgB32]MCK9895308.1 NAD(P)H-binding protein [Frankia sp. AgB32]